METVSLVLDWQYLKMEDKTMIDVSLLLEVLKFFLMFYGLYRAHQQKQKEKALTETVEKLSQRLIKLENVKKRKKLRRWQLPTGNNKLPPPFSILAN